MDRVAVFIDAGSDAREVGHDVPVEPDEPVHRSLRYVHIVPTVKVARPADTDALHVQSAHIEAGVDPAGSMCVSEVSRFFGIVIAMFYNEHGVPHFHAAYGGHEVSMEIDTSRVRGVLPPRALRLVVEWTDLHRRELHENWQRARQGQPLERIAPLE